jgi:hypothetical protein
MTREKQIIEYLKERNIPFDSLEANSIMEGIAWADEHPKDGIMSLEKVCEFFRCKIIKINPTYREFPTALDDIMNDFKKELLK